MNYLLKFFTVTIFLSAISAFAGDVFVVGNANVNLTSAEVKDVFSGEKQTAGSVKLSIVDNKANQDDFLSKVMGVDKVKYNSTWAKKSFQDAIAAPKIKGTDSDVIEFVKSTPGGIGYVSAPGDAKVIGKF